MKRRDEGYATITAAGFAAALVALAAVVGGAAALVIAHHEARVAADLSAVAGAFASYRGEDGCATAKAVAEYNEASISSCDRAESDIIVTVKIRGREVKSRAGPV